MAATAQATCSYCGATLDPRTYFCRRCATPYQPVEDVLPPEHRVRATIGMRVRQHAPEVWTLFWTYVAVVAGGGIVAFVALGEERPVATLVLLDALVLVTTIAFAVRYGRSLLPQLARVGFDRWEAWVGLLALAPLLAVNHAWHDFVQRLAGFEGPDFLTLLREAGAPEGALFLSVAVLPAFAEEIAFRGLVQHWLELAIPATTAVLLAAALFTALHASLASAPYLFLLGCLLGWLKHRTGSLWPPIAAHLLHNAAVLAWPAP